MNTIRLITAALLLFSTSVLAGPTYLRCTLPQVQGAAAATVDITVDEAAQSVRLSVPGLGSPAMAMASTFSPTRVEFSGRGPYGVRYGVDRTTLAIQRLAPYPSEGACTLAQAPPADRKF